ncbi:HD domain-containing protein [Nocardia amamiensis]|uniref:HD domain-containing protein n=1 Tax=Nocardia amamiensis TaxID=404578 RepID=A0ABS0CW91_9NOCA|nr:HD domain-containing protein [Nocardia amamiensis]MBF6300425.1 HD domain-containing protein [Nocardia amamiensis]
MAPPQGFDWHWAATSGGNLTRRQMNQLLGLLLFAMPTVLGGRVAAFFGTGAAKARLDEAALRPPDTAMALAAQREAHGVLSPTMIEHSYRVWAFGKALAHAHGAQLDDELFFTAAMLHDIELEHPQPNRCFAVRGAEHATRILSALGEPADRVALIRDGIASHMTLGVDSDLSDLAGALSAGAGVDLFGNRLHELDPQWVTEVIAHHPRLDFKRLVIDVVAREAAAVPDGRTALLHRFGMFDLMVQSAPFSE